MSTGSRIQQPQVDRVSQPFDPDVMLDFVGSVPPSVVRLLVELAPIISWLRWSLQVMSWRSSRPSESWLMLAGLWVACFSAHSIFRYFLPIIALLPRILSTLSTYIPKNRQTAASSSVPVTTEDTLANTLSEITILNHLLPRLPTIDEHFALPWPVLLQLIAILYVPYLGLMYFVPMKMVVAIAFTVILTWRAPWIRTTRQILASNGWVQYGIHRLWRALTFNPYLQRFSSEMSYPQGTPVALSSNKDTASPTGPTVSEAAILSEVPPACTLRFRFTVHENQRWWVGLDWTAALLPQERASWTSSPPALRPLPPPMSISLPPTKTVLLPLPGKGKEHLRMKRTAAWKWEESDWGVVVRLSASTVAERVVMALPKIKDDVHLPANVSSPTTAAESLLQRGLQRVATVDLRSVGGPSAVHDVPPSASPTDERHGHGHEVGVTTGGGEIGDGSGVGDVARATPEEDLTDAEGWIYADNKWEGGGPKGGMGKYTRHRRWTRVAILFETVEIVPAPSPSSILSTRSPPSMPLLPLPESDGHRHHRRRTSSTSHSNPNLSPTRSLILPPTTAPPTETNIELLDKPLHAEGPGVGESDHKEKGLRNRLKAAVKVHGHVS